jgi:hypothetical protein
MIAPLDPEGPEPLAVSTHFFQNSSRSAAETPPDRPGVIVRYRDAVSLMSSLIVISRTDSYKNLLYIYTIQIRTALTLSVSSLGMTHPSFDRHVYCQIIHDPMTCQYQWVQADETLISMSDSARKMTSGTNLGKQSERPYKMKQGCTDKGFMCYPD